MRCVGVRSSTRAFEPRLERGNVIKVRNRTMFDFNMGLPHTGIFSETFLFRPFILSLSPALYV